MSSIEENAERVLMIRDGHEIRWLDQSGERTADELVITRAGEAGDA